MKGSCLRKSCRALKPEGRLLLDARSLLNLVRIFVPRRWDPLPGGARLIEDDSFDPLTGRVESRWTVQHADGGETALHHSLRLYTPREMLLLMRRCGLTLERIHGSLTGAEFTLESTRTVFVARKTPALHV